MVDNLTERESGDKQSTDQALDDRGTDQAGGLIILQQLRDRGFESSDEKLAVALGRPLEEVQEWMTGNATIDDDVVMKARGIAKQRGIEIE